MTLDDHDDEFDRHALDIPIGPLLDDNDTIGHVDVHLSPSERQALARMLTGLRLSGAELRSGVPVHRAAHVVRWILQQRL